MPKATKLRRKQFWSATAEIPKLAALSFPEDRE